MQTTSTRPIVVRLTVIKAKTWPGIEANFHSATTVPPSRDFALLFLGRFVLSFFVPPILTVFYLIDRVTKNRKRRGCEGSLAPAPIIDLAFK